MSHGPYLGQAVCICVDVWKREWKCPCECANVLKKEKAQMSGRFAGVCLCAELADAHNVIHCILCFNSYPCFAQGYTANACLGKQMIYEWNHPPYSLLMNIWQQQQIVCIKLFPLLCLFYFLTPYGEQTELPLALLMQLNMFNCVCTCVNKCVCSRVCILIYSWKGFSV